jgi:TPR repeat protein
MKDQVDPPPHNSSESDEVQLLRAYRDLSSAPERAISAFTALANNGSPMAMLYLGYALRSGIGVAPDALRAEFWYRRAADLGITRARYHLGRLYLDARRYADAHVEFERSASDGFAPSLHFLGRIYYFGFGLTVDKQKGRMFLHSAAQGGCVFAKALLAHDLIHEIGGLGATARGLLMKFSCYVRLIGILWVDGMSSDQLR